MDALRDELLRRGHTVAQASPLRPGMRHAGLQGLSLGRRRAGPGRRAAHPRRVLPLKPACLPACRQTPSSPRAQRQATPPGKCRDAPAAALRMTGPRKHPARA